MVPVQLSMRSKRVVGGDSADNPSSLKRSFVVVEWWSSVVGPEAEKEGRKRGARSPPHSDRLYSFTFIRIISSILKFKKLKSYEGDFYS